MEVETLYKNNITKEFLEKHLKRKVLRFKVEGGSKPGDNFLSVLISLEVYLVNEITPLYLLLKTFPQHPLRQKFLQDTNMFRKELLVYDTWLPELVKFQKELVGNEKILKLAFPPLVAGATIDYKNEDKDTQDDNTVLSNYLLMVDVRKTWGFNMADKMRGLSYGHVKATLFELAKYHALTYAYKIHHNLSNLLTKFPFLEDSIFLSQMATVDAMIKVNHQVFYDVMNDFLKKHPHIAAAMKRFEDTEKISDILRRFRDPEGVDEEEVESLMRENQNFSGPPLKEQWIVGGHGDSWTNNMLFKSDSKSDELEVILVDLQIAREGCITSDLTYFIYTSTDTEFRKKYLDEMLALYYENFEEFCKILKVKPFSGFTLENFKRKFHRSKLFGFLSAYIVLPIILQNPGSEMDMDAVDVGESAGENDGVADIFAKMQQNDDSGGVLLRDRFGPLLIELYEEGVL